MNANPQASADAARLRYESTLRQGFPWLRFPMALEAEFNADNFSARKRYLLLCAISGLFAFILAALFDNLPLPDIPDLVRIANYGAPALILLGLIPIALTRKSWVQEGTYALNATIAGLLSIAVLAQSKAFTMYAHSMVAVLFVCAVTVGARLRFWYSFCSGIVTVAAYYLLVRGTTPLEQVIVKDNFEILLTASAFVLFANYVLEYRDRRVYLLRKLDRCRQQILEETQQQLRALAMLDSLTGLHNRRQFEFDLSGALRNRSTPSSTIAMLLIDIDFFKLFNDGYGHPAGDICLQQVAAVLQQQAAAHGGSAARFGGEEFALLLPGRDLNGALHIGAELCAAVRAAAVPHVYSPVTGEVTVSVGVGQVSLSEEVAQPRTSQVHAMRDGLIAMADDGLYRAKASGRNRVMAGVPAMPADSPIDTPIDSPRAESAGLAPAEFASNDRFSPEAAGDPLAPLLQRPYWKLRFPSDIEADYQVARGDEHHRLLSIGGLAGSLLFAVFLVHDIHLFPDLTGTGDAWLVALLGFLLLGTAASHCLRPRLFIRDLAASSSVVVTAVVLLWVLSTSEAIVAYSHSVIVILVVLHAGVGMRLPFRHVLLVSYAVLACYLVLRRGHEAEQDLIELDVAFIIYVAGQFTVLASFQLEHVERSTYLLGRQAQRQLEALELATEQLRKLSSIDPLTGIANRRRFETELTATWNAALAAQHPVCLLIVDVDHFKLYNDGYGHPAGDVCLKSIAMILDDLATRAGGLAARLGGEEFAILLNAGEADYAWRLGEQICTTIYAHALPHRYSVTADRVTVSVGVSTQVPTAEPGRQALLQAADQALYRAKESGRNRVMGEACDARRLSSVASRLL